MQPSQKWQLLYSVLRTLIGLTTVIMKSLHCRRLHQAFILLFKCLSSTGPTYIGNLLTIGIHRMG